jgi:hypothetical protein
MTFVLVPPSFVSAGNRSSSSFSESFQHDRARRDGTLRDRGCKVLVGTVDTSDTAEQLLFKNSGSPRTALSTKFVVGVISVPPNDFHSKVLLEQIPNLNDVTYHLSTPSTRHICNNFAATAPRRQESTRASQQPFTANNAVPLQLEIETLAWASLSTFHVSDKISRQPHKMQMETVHSTAGSDRAQAPADTTSD